MSTLIRIILPLFTLIYSCTVKGQEQIVFLGKYKEPIQNYIMTGHEKGWKDCDILSVNTVSHGDTPQFSMEVDKIENLIKKSALAFSNCLLINYEVDSKASLSALLNFGWAAINHVRLALVLKLDSGFTVEFAANTTKLPFLVATKSGPSREHFLCPVMGDIGPWLEKEMCKSSFLSYRNKKLRITHLGVPPDFLITTNGDLDGTNIRIMKILEDKFQFRSKTMIAKSFKDGGDLVCDNLHKSRSLVRATYVWSFFI